MGLVVKIPTNGMIISLYFRVLKRLLISYPNKSSPSFLNPQGQCSGILNPPQVYEGMKSFSEKNTKRTNFFKRCKVVPQISRERNE